MARDERFVVAEAERGLRLDRFLAARIPRMSRTSVQVAIAERVTISSGAAPKPSRQVFPGEVVTITARPIPDAALRRERPVVLHEGDGFVVVDKPAGISTTPSASRPGEDVATLTGLAPAHRLDRFTSGCLVLTWQAEAARHFERAFREHLVEKSYLAIVRGVPREASFAVDAPLVVDASSRVPSKMRGARKDEDAPPAQTSFELLATSPGGSASLLLAMPLTGRRHQVRVHAALAGHPIVGDLLYGGDERDFIRFQLGQPVATPDGLVPGRHLLHASRLRFPAPTGESIVVEAPLPGDCPAWARSAREQGRRERGRLERGRRERADAG